MLIWIGMMLTAIVVLLALILYRLTGLLGEVAGVGYYVLAIYERTRDAS